MTDSAFMINVSCMMGLEGILENELVMLGIEDTKTYPGGVRFEGGLDRAYRTVLWSRIASRVTVILSEFEIEDDRSANKAASAIEWDEHFTHENTFLLSLSGKSQNITHTKYALLTVKDAVADYFRNKTNTRPSVDTENPDIRIHLHLFGRKGRIGIDLSGEGLHKRGYRTDAVEAPLRENLAAAILYIMKWPALAAEQKPFLDLTCGSGTAVIEAAMIAADIAPGLMKSDPGFFSWKLHRREIWEEAVSEAESRRKKISLSEVVRIVGYDNDREAVRISLDNAKRAGVDEWVSFVKSDLRDVKNQFEEKGLVFSNPPYGERMGEEEELPLLYEEIGNLFKKEFYGWEAAVFTGNPDLMKSLKLRPKKTKDLYNGNIECVLFQYSVDEKFYFREEKAESEIISSGAEMFANRIKKNLKQFGKWARKNQIECYRLYDADIPQYSIAVDVYGNNLHVQEYDAPSSIDPVKARKRLHEAMDALVNLEQFEKDNIYLKVRKRQKGIAQYDRHGEEGKWHIVSEGGLRFLVNFTDYLDTGLFLDHRITREMVRSLSSGKKVLNLFAYTGSFTVYAASGGAKKTTTVDLSRTYLEIAQKNMRLNGFSGEEHVFIQADCIQWLKDCRDKFDLIVLDPPTFSNSKSFEGVLDTQRDHPSMIDSAAVLLAKDGILIFSTNNRKFRMDASVEAKYKLEEISASTIPKDFEGNSKIHRCWKISN